MIIAGYGCLKHGRELCMECMKAPAPPSYRELKAQVASLQAELDKRQWVPASERLPEHEQMVLLFHRDWGESICRWNVYSPRANEVGLVPTPATHWMPLPEAPE